MFGRTCDIQLWDIIFRGWRWLYPPQDEVFRPCGDVSSHKTDVFVPAGGLLEL